MFLRFVRQAEVEGTAARAGFLNAAYELQTQEGIDEATLARLNRLIGWFRKNLAVPPKFNRSNSKGDFRRQHTAGLSWFKASAEDHLSKAFELVALLSENGYPMTVLKTARPGFVIYEDDFQVVAEPFADTKTR